MLLAALALSASAPAFGPVTPVIDNIIEQYMNFGVNPKFPTQYSCPTWAKLFDSDQGTRQTPGLPPATGQDQLEATCEDDHALFTDLFDTTDEPPLNVTSWNGETRTAFLWHINGVRADGSEVSVPVITALFLTKQIKIQEAWDFLDPSQITPNGTHPDNGNFSELVQAYTQFGGGKNGNCTAFGQLFDADGDRNTPGQPLCNTPEQITKCCESVRPGFSVYAPDVVEVIGSTSWNMETRVAFRWSINGQVGQNRVETPAITMLLMGSDGKIQKAWDFLDPHGLP